ncbi:MAG: DUF1330 domain-containing protein [Brachymonas sp.]|nr:DUF1330 domain-containing protein [Brachymonas sp.]
MASGYIIGHVDVADPVQYEAYKRLSSAAIQTYEAEVLVRGGAQQVVEGQLPTRTVVLRFASFAAAKAFHDSPEYRAARAARAGIAEMQMVCVEGVDG